MSVSELRRAMAAGIAFVVLLVVGVFVGFGNTPNVKSHDSAAVAAAKYVSKLSDSGARTGILVGAYLMILAAIAFVWFSRGLGQLMPTPAGARLVSGLGVLGAAGIAVGAITNAGIAGAVSFGDEPVPNGDSARAVMDLAFPLIGVVFALTCAALIAAIAVRGRVLPAWLRYTAWLGVLGGIFAVIFTPLVLPLLWFLIVAILVLARPAAASATPAAGTP
jgi:hypothetical protein